MSIFRFIGIAVAAMFFASVSAQARIVTDQEQPLIDPDAGFLGVGGDSEQQLAQTFTVGVSGMLAGLRLPVVCGSGDLIIELREVVGGQPTGPVLRTIRLGTGDTPAAPDGFHDYLFDTPLSVNAGDVLAFTLRMEPPTANCSYPQAPAGDTYPRGSAFFDARPNPPGWVSQKEFPSEWQDLAFYTLMDAPDAPPRRATGCIIPGRIDPATGLPLELPISRFTPACRCFQDEIAREFRCGILHPDFFITRRTPIPLIPGQAFEEIWELKPLTELDGPVIISLSGGGLKEPIKAAFEAEFKRTKKASRYYLGAKGGTQYLRVNVTAPENPGFYPGVAAFTYKMKDAPNEYVDSFGLDTSIEPEEFGGN